MQMYVSEGADPEDNCPADFAGGFRVQNAIEGGFHIR
jgi:hypothetical protein